jgi:hypothetical protein
MASISVFCFIRVRNESKKGKIRKLARCAEENREVRGNIA